MGEQSGERPRFHLAFPVLDIERARAFYCDLLGAGVGRSAERWMDFDFYGHQIVAHRVDGMDPVGSNQVDGDEVPARHFGVILPWDSWHALSQRLTAAGVDFMIAPHLRFVGEAGEQATMFLRDPSGNAIELKSFKDDDAVFAR